MNKIKYTKESLFDICHGAKSTREVLERLQLKSGSHKRLFKLIKEVLIEQGTYKGKGSNIGKTQPRLTNEEFFTKDRSKVTTNYVRLRLFKSGLKEKVCEVCHNSSWLDKPIPLEVHHIDGNKYNNELSNLQILCPNCHYFTDTYKTKNIKVPVT